MIDFHIVNQTIRMSGERIGQCWGATRALTRWRDITRSVFKRLIEGAPIPQEKVMSCPKAINPCRLKIAKLISKNHDRCAIWQYFQGSQQFCQVSRGFAHSARFTPGYYLSRFQRSKSTFQPPQNPLQSGDFRCLCANLIKF
jgi:hypothetical protein